HALSFFFSSRRRHTRFSRDWSSDVCSSDLALGVLDVVLLAAVDGVVLLAVDLEDAERALVEGTEQAVVDQHEVAGHVGLELDDRSEERRVGKEGTAGTQL